MVPICPEQWCTEANEAIQTHCYNPVVPTYPVWAYYAHGRQHRCQEDPVSLPSGRLEKTTIPTGSETTPPCTPWSSNDDVDVWHYAILESHARNDDDDIRSRNCDLNAWFFFSLLSSIFIVWLILSFMSVFTLQRCWMTTMVHRVIKTAVLHQTVRMIHSAASSTTVGAVPIKRNINKVSRFPHHICCDKKRGNFWQFVVNFWLDFVVASHFHCSTIDRNCVSLWLNYLEIGFYIFQDNCSSL